MRTHSPGYDKQLQISALAGKLKVPLGRLLERAHITANDIVLIAGTLIEGIGTPCSDFDVYIIKEARIRPDELPPNCSHRYMTNNGEVVVTYETLPETNIGVDIEYKTTSELKNAIKDVSQLYNYLRQRAKFSGTKGDHEQLIYRAFHAIPVQNADAFRSLIGNLKAHEVCFNAYRRSAFSYPYFRDIVGCWRQGDFETSFLMARKWGLDNARAFTHLNGNVNTGDKYLLRYVARLPTRDDDIKSIVQRLATAGATTAKQLREYVLDWCDAVDMIAARSLSIRNTTRGFPSTDDQLALTRLEVSASLRWHTELSREFAYRNREFLRGLPPLREFLDEIPGPALARYLADDEVPTWVKVKTGRPLEEALNWRD